MQSVLADIAVVLIAALHFWFLALEMFFWDKPLGLRTFGMSAEEAALTKPLAMNQGLYNGFLAAGLLWGVAAAGDAVTLFFLGCVIVAGVFGALTASRKILWVQAVPGLIALLLVLLRPGTLAGT